MIDEEAATRDPSLDDTPSPTTTSFFTSSSSSGRLEKGRQFSMSMSSSTTPNDEEICSCSPTTITFKLDTCLTCNDNTISDNTGLDGSFCFTEANVTLPGADDEPSNEDEDNEEGESSSTTTDDEEEEEVRYLQNEDDDDEACANHGFYSMKINGRTRCTNRHDSVHDATMFSTSEECCAATFKDVTNCIIVDVCLSTGPTESPTSTTSDDDDDESSGSTSSTTTTLAPTPTVSREAATYSPTTTTTNSDGTSSTPTTTTTSTGCNDNNNDPIIEIISIQFLEFDTSGDLNVINQDNTYLSPNVSLTTGDTVTYTSISSYLDTSSPLSHDNYTTNNSPPGGASLILYGKTTSGNIVRNRFFWTYSLSCNDDNVPLVVGDSIGWVTVVSGRSCTCDVLICSHTLFAKNLLLFYVVSISMYIKSEISNAWPVFCPALPSNTPTITPGLTTSPTEVFPTSSPTETGTSSTTSDGSTDDGNNNNNTMCSFCEPDGVEFPDLILPTDDGTTCTIASEYAATLMANDVMCPTVLMAEALCCPNNSGTDNTGGDGTDDEPQPEPCEGNIIDVANENEDFTTLVASITAAGLVDELSGEGPFTVFGTRVYSGLVIQHTPPDSILTFSPPIFQPLFFNSHSLFIFILRYYYSSTHQ
jgi:hypothetical protein